MCNSKWIKLDDAKQLVANGVVAVCEGANMPTTLEATKYLQEIRSSLSLVKQVMPAG